MLKLIGLGLTDENDISLRGIEEAKKSDHVFIEKYTGIWEGNLESLKKIIGKKIGELKRSDLEDNSQKILDLSKNNDVSILIQGDPLVATTHISLILEAKKQKIETKIIHSSSIFSAIAETGLHIYKFGQTVTIPMRERTKNLLPESVYETIRSNKQMGMHTLCLLDVDGEKNRFLTPKEALEILLEIEKKRGEGVLNEKTEVVIFSKIGSEDQNLTFSSIGNILGNEEAAVPAIIVLPGTLHFTEREYLEQYRNL